VTKTGCSAELYLDKGKGAEQETKQIFDQLQQSQAQINAAIAFPVAWQRLDDRRACRALRPSHRRPASEWRNIDFPILPGFYNGICPSHGRHIGLNT
jgi:hypothetical protein